MQHTRYYVHGDQSEEDADLYYCSACDVFFDKIHFEWHTEENLSRYDASLKTFLALVKGGRQWSRPQYPCNLFY